MEAEFISQPRTQKFGDTEQVTGPPCDLLSPPIKWADIIPSLMIMRTQRCEKGRVLSRGPHMAGAPQMLGR